MRLETRNEAPKDSDSVIRPDKAMTLPGSTEQEKHFAERFQFVLEHVAELSKLGALPCPRMAPACPRRDEQRRVFQLLILAMPYPPLERGLAIALDAVKARAMDIVPPLKGQLESLQGDAQTRLDFHDCLLTFARDPATPRLLAALKALLRSENRSELARNVPKNISVTSLFPDSCALETAWLARPGETLGDPSCSAAASQREPWVKSPARDYFGVALSGGGIRSAIFGLGALQALANLGLLSQVDYVSTVSGGGYIGGFWTAYRRRTSNNEFPPGSSGQGDRREHVTIRHLREFSRFLVPRVGFAQPEVWNAVVVILGGMLASLLATTAALALCLYLWQAGARWLSGHGPVIGAVAFGVFTALIHWFLHQRLVHVGKLDDDEIKSFVPKALGLAAGFGAGVCWWLLGSGGLHDHPLFDVFVVGPGHSSPSCILTPAAAWTVTALAGLVVRVLAARWSDVRFGAILDRGIGRCLALAALAGALGLVWSLAGWFSIRWRSLGAAGALSTVTFVWLYDWLKAPVEATRGSALLSRLVRLAKPMLPQIAANVAALIIVIAVAMLVQAFGFGDPENRRHVYFGMAGSFCVVLGTLFLFDPARVGLHDFYRGRIARCFLGAARVSAHPEDPRARPPAVTTEKPDDDVTLGELRWQGTKHATSDARGPLHLICCAANNLDGDALGNLYRGARSAVLSPFGVSLGSFSAPLDDLRLSAALTASAAAFNSQMGCISIHLGPAVAFLMCALNLRLGLWVPHPMSAGTQRHIGVLGKAGLAPGSSFFLEALGKSRSDQVTNREFVASDAWLVRANRKVSKLHLSDGGHFENLGLYELVRRHCRYVLVSDASADPDLSFDDLGNAIRRVREDFGVEIELDIAPLRKKPDGDSAQHAVIGTIHYDGLEGGDKGTLIYLKPTLTGDEPIDVLERRSRSRSFPHDATGDQFYDDAQWESYRRLGEHCTMAVPGWAAIQTGTSRQLGDLFTVTNPRWHPAPRDPDQKGRKFTERRASIEAGVRENAPGLPPALDGYGMGLLSSEPSGSADEPADPSG